MQGGASLQDQRFEDIDDRQSQGVFDFDLWEAGRDTMDAATSYEELLAKVKDYQRRRKLDSSVKGKMQHGGDPMDVGAVEG